MALRFGAVLMWKIEGIACPEFYFFQNEIDILKTNVMNDGGTSRQKQHSSNDGKTIPESARQCQKRTTTSIIQIPSHVTRVQKRVSSVKA